MGQESELRQLADELELRRLIARYAQGADRRDGAHFGATFAPHAVLEGDGFRFATPQEISGVPAQLQRFEKTYHTLLNFVVDLHGDRATGEVYSMAHHLTPLGAGRYNDLVMYITYRDRYARGEAGWQFEHRKVVIEFTESRTVENLGKLPKP